MSAFVGVKTVETAETLKNLIEEVIKSDHCYFLRWPHKVSGLCHTLPNDFPSPEGQVFTRDLELRWKRQGTGYSVLVLSQAGHIDGFKPLAIEVNGSEPLVIEWETRDRPVHIYPSTETRFPQGVADCKNNIDQRYFLNRKTATVHFVALVAR